jgi:acyl dehydratase
MIAIENLERLRELAGQEVGTSEWMAVSQARIQAFADATGDQQWIHVDPERARAETPFGGTIAHGFLTLSLLSVLVQNTLAIGGVRMAINYGLNRVRFVSPVPAGSRIRARFALDKVADVDGGVQATWTITVEREGHEEPCLVAQWLVRYVASGPPSIQSSGTTSA